MHHHNGVEILAGNGKDGFKDEKGKEAMFHNPEGITLSKDKKDLFVADQNNSCIRKISLVDGTISTVAGIPGREWNYIFILKNMDFTSTPCQSVFSSFFW